MNKAPSTVYHFGPSTRGIGGMSSVIETLAANEMGADRVIAIPTWTANAHFRSSILALCAAATVLRVPRASTIHVHMSEGGSFLREALIVATARARHLPCVVSIHGAAFVAFSEDWPQLVARVLGMASVVTVLSEDARDAVRRTGAAIRVELIPNPVMVDLAAMPANHTSELVLFAGEVGVRKGADVLADAWREVALRRPHATCVMVGPSTGLTLPDIDRLEVRGPVDRNEVRHLVRQARVIALPSRAEAMPMILAEATAAARPFVSTPVGGIELIAAGGTLVPVDDHKALADALMAYLAHPECARAAGARGQKLCEEHMSIGVIDTLFRELYASAR